MEYRSITKDGRVVWLRDHAVLVHGGLGEPSYWHGFVLDITEQKLHTGDSTSAAQGTWGAEGHGT